MRGSLKNITLILQKELRTFFNSPIAYIVIIVFLLIAGYFFTAPLFIVNQATIRHFIDLVPLLYIFFIPAITMRLFAEEYKSGTIEILVTLPVEDYEILIGKYLSTVVFVIIAVLSTLIFPITVTLLGQIDWGQVIASYIGLVFTAAAFLAIGIFSSVLTKNQIIAFIIGFLICFSLFILGKISGVFVSPVFALLVDFIGLDRHFENISRGVIDTKDILYYLSIVVLFLYATLCIIKSRK